MQFSIRSLLIFTTVMAIFTPALWRYAADLGANWNRPSAPTVDLPDFGVTRVNSVVIVADEGTVLLSGPLPGSLRSDTLSEADCR